MNGRWGKILAPIIFLTIIISIRFSPVAQFLSIATLLDQRDNLRILVQNSYALSVLIYILSYTVLSALSFPGAAIVTMAGGFLFGTGWGTVFSNLGATSGGCFAFLIARYLVGKPLQERYQEKFVKFNNEFKKNGAAYLLTMRLIAVLPFFIANILASMTEVSLKTFLWTTMLGIIPGSFVYAYAGAQLNYITAPKDIFSRNVIVSFIFLITLSIIPIIIKKLRNKS